MINKKRKYIEDKWKYYLENIFYRRKDIKISSDIIFRNLYNITGRKDVTPGFEYTYKFDNIILNFYIIIDYFTFEHKRCSGVITIGSVQINMDGEKEITKTISKFVSDLQSKVEEILSSNSLFQTISFWVDGDNFLITDRKYRFDTLSILDKIRENLEKNKWKGVLDEDDGEFYNYYFPKRP